MSTNWNQRGMTHFAQGNWPDAVRCFLRACQQSPRQPDSWHNLGSAYAVQGRFAEAEEAYKHVLALAPGNLDTLSGLAQIYNTLERHEEALAYRQQAVALAPQSVGLLSQLGATYAKLGREEEAMAVFRQVLQVQPENGQILDLLCKMHLARNDAAQALPLAQRLHELDPADPERMVQLVTCLLGTGAFSQAEAYGLKALERFPDRPEFYSLVYTACTEQGLSPALDLLKRAVELFPEYPHWLSTLIFSAQADPETSVEEHSAWCRLWHERFAMPYQSQAPLFVQPPVPERKLRLGYVSGDFKQHSAAQVFGAVFKHADRAHFEITAYNNSPAQDEATRFFRHYSDQWVDVWELDDDQLARRIRDDRIDILVDLSGHTRANRLGVFARKPAPVQITGLGYGCSTGLSAMDYRFSDPYIAPPDLARLYPEKVLYLSSLILWSPDHHHREEILPTPPLAANGFLTLGYGNSPMKTHPRLLALWARLLQAHPGAILHFKNGLFDSPDLQANYRQFFTEKGVDPERLRFSGRTSHSLHMQFYSQVDIVLDPFPYTGGISTCDALSMGVPVVTMATRNGTRGSLSILNNVGLSELVARDEDEYLALITRLAAQPDTLARYRRELPEHLYASAVCDGRHFAGEVETCYRQVWRHWCQQAVADSLRQHLLDGMQAHLQGHLEEAEVCYRQVLEIEPRQADALHALGILAFQRRDLACLDLFTQAIEAQPSQDAAWFNLGIAQDAAGQVEEARASFERAWHLNPILERTAVPKLVFPVSPTALASARV